MGCRNLSSPLRLQNLACPCEALLRFRFFAFAYGCQPVTISVCQQKLLRRVRPNMAAGALGYAHPRTLQPPIVSLTAIAALLNIEAMLELMLEGENQSVL